MLQGARGKTGVLLFAARGVTGGGVLSFPKSFWVCALVVECVCGVFVCTRAFSIFLHVYAPHSHSYIYNLDVVVSSRSPLWG